MTYEEAKQKALTVRWTVYKGSVFTDDSRWKYQNRNYKFFVLSSDDDEVLEHIVKIHNEYVFDLQKNFHDCKHPGFKRIEMRLPGRVWIYRRRTSTIINSVNPAPTNIQCHHLNRSGGAVISCVNVTGTFTKTVSDRHSPFK